MYGVLYLSVAIPSFPIPLFLTKGGAPIVSHHAALLLLSIGPAAIIHHHIFMVLIEYKTRNYNAHLISLQLMLVSTRLRKRCHSLLASI